MSMFRKTIQYGGTTLEYSVNLLRRLEIVTSHTIKIHYLYKINQHILFHKKGSNSIVELVNSSLPLRKDLIVEVLTVGSLHPPQVCLVSQNSLFKP